MSGYWNLSLDDMRHNNFHATLLLVSCTCTVKLEKEILMPRSHTSLNLTRLELWNHGSSETRRLKCKECSQACDIKCPDVVRTCRKVLKPRIFLRVEFRYTVYRFTDIATRDRDSHSKVIMLTQITGLGIHK